MDKKHQREWQYSVVARRSSYGTYIVEANGKREYETNNKIKATGVAEYLSYYYAIIPDMFGKGR